MDNCIFRAMGPEEAPRMIELVRERIAWMDREGLQSWNTSDYLEIYPQDYYEERAREGVLFALARASDGKILCAGALLETDERWPDSLPAVYVHHLVSGTEARGAGAHFLARAEDYARQVSAKLEELGFRTEVDERNEKIGKKIREATLEKVPFMLVVGDRDMENGTVSPRRRSGEDLGAMSMDQFAALLGDEVKSKAIK